MASNNVSAIIPTLLMQGILVLRQNAVTPRLIANMTDTIAARKGSTVTVPIPSAITAADITPAAYAPDAGAQVPTTATVALDKWKEAAFDLSDKEISQIENGSIPMIAEEAVKSLANAVDASIHALYYKFYGYYGTAGTTPFGTPGIADATGIRKTLNNQLAPLEPRHIVLNPDAEAAALGLEPLANMNFSGDVSAMREGQLQRRLGMTWHMNQNVTTHTAGTAASSTTNAAGYAVGVKTITLASAGTGTWVVGDIFTIAGDLQTYVITAGDTDVSNGGTISFEPGLKVAITTAATALTRKATHVANLAFHRDAFVFASRPLEEDAGAGFIVPPMSMIDPVSGLPLRLEVRREHYRTRWSFSLLWGVDVYRRELGARLAG